MSRKSYRTDFSDQVAASTHSSDKFLTRKQARIAEKEAKRFSLRRQKQKRAPSHGVKQEFPKQRYGFRFKTLVMSFIYLFSLTAGLPAYATFTDGSAEGAARTNYAIQTLTGGSDSASQIVSRENILVEGEDPELNSTLNPIVSPRVQALAAELMVAVNQGRLVGSRPNHIPFINNLAEGKAVANCGIDYRVLQTISVALDHFSHVGVSDINRLCTGQIEGAGRNSSHYSNGGGHAVDFYLLDRRPVSGGDQKSLKLLEILDPLVPPGTGLGQIECRAKNNFVNFAPFSDTCNHIHIDFARVRESRLKPWK